MPGIVASRSFTFLALPTILVLPIIDLFRALHIRDRFHIVAKMKKVLDDLSPINAASAPYCFS
jgi:hypothetical protein